MNSYKTKQLKIIIFSLFIVLLDQITKLFVLNSLGFEKSRILIPGLIRITLVKNTGAAFSLFNNLTPLLTFISLIVSIILITILWLYPPKSKWKSNGLVCLLGGSLGNGLDRLFRGFVLDFFDFIPFNFPIFNIADISINIAIVCFIISILKNKKQREKY